MIIAAQAFAKEGIRTNVTLCFSAAQAIVAAKAGAHIVSPFVGRVDDMGFPGVDVLSDILTIYRNYGFKTQVLAASVRGPLHLVQAAKAGAHIVTLTLKVLEQVFQHPLTEKGLERFLKDHRDAFDLTIGGSGAIAACAAARLGLRTALAAVVGDDLFGRFMVAALAERGVNTEAIVVDPHARTGPDELYETLKPFKDRVAEDIRGGEGEA